MDRLSAGIWAGQDGLQSLQPLECPRRAARHSGEPPGEAGVLSCGRITTRRSVIPALSAQNPEERAPGLPECWSRRREVGGHPKLTGPRKKRAPTSHQRAASANGKGGGDRGYGLGCKTAQSIPQIATARRGQVLNRPSLCVTMAARSQGAPYWEGVLSPGPPKFRSVQHALRGAR
jgi:hypothetical protein